MGSSNSRRMEQFDDTYDSTDLATIIQYLIQSGQVHIATIRDNEMLTSDSDEDYFTNPVTIPKSSKPNTEELDKSEISSTVKQASGLCFKTGHERPKSIVNMLCARERGLPGSTSFGKSDKRKVANTFLPNHKRRVDSLRSKIFCVSFSKSGDNFIVASQDRKIRLYSADYGKYTLSKEIDARDVGWSILDVAYSPDGNYVAYSSWSESIHIFQLYGDTENHKSLTLCPEERRFCIFSLAYSSDGNEILCGSNDGYIYIYDQESNQRALKIEGHDDDVNTVAFADNTSQILFSGGDDGICKVWDRRTLNELHPKPVGSLAGHIDGIVHIEPKGDGRHLLSNSKDQSIKLWDIRKFSSDEALSRGKLIVSDQNWDYRWQKVPKTLHNSKNALVGDTSIVSYTGHSVLQTLCRCHFSPLETTGQRYIYVACAAGRVIIYDMLTGKIEKKLEGHRSCVRDVSWHPYKNEIVSGSWDGAVFQWEYRDHMEQDEDHKNWIEILPQKTKEKVERNGGVHLRRSERIAHRLARQREEEDDIDDHSRRGSSSRF